MNDLERKIYTVVPIKVGVGPFKVTISHKIDKPVSPDDGLNSQVDLATIRHWTEFYPMLIFAKVKSSDSLEKITIGVDSVGEIPEPLEGEQINRDRLVRQRLHYGLPTDSLPPISFVEKVIALIHHN